MKKLDLGQTVSILANLGVIAGILFLAVEVSQNQTALEEGNRISAMTAAQNSVSNFSSLRTLLAENGELAEIWHRGSIGEPLTAVETQRFDQICRNEIWAYWGVAAQDLIDGDGAGQFVEAAHTLIGKQIATNPAYAACWSNLKEELSTWGFDGFVTGVEGASK